MSYIQGPTIGYEKRFNRAIDSLSNLEKFVDYKRLKDNGNIRLCT